MSTRTINNHLYKIVLQQPPGRIVAPHGFPTNPRPKNAAKIFLDAMELRIEVFVDEQGCDITYELDEDDVRSWSWVVYRGDGDDRWKAVSSIRIVPPPHAPHPNGFVDHEEEEYIKLTRVVTAKEERGKGLARWLCEEAFGFLGLKRVEVAGREWKGLVLTHAQTGVEGLYERMGFVTDEKLGRWDEEGIEHCGMWKKLDMKIGNQVED